MSGCYIEKGKILWKKKKKSICNELHGQLLSADCSFWNCIVMNIISPVQHTQVYHPSWHQLEIIVTTLADSSNVIRCVCAQMPRCFDPYVPSNEWRLLHMCKSARAHRTLQVGEATKYNGQKAPWGQNTTRSGIAVIRKIVTMTYLSICKYFISRLQTWVLRQIWDFKVLSQRHHKMWKWQSNKENFFCPFW